MALSFLNLWPSWLMRVVFEDFRLQYHAESSNRGGGPASARCGYILHKQQHSTRLKSSASCSHCRALRIVRSQTTTSLYTTPLKTSSLAAVLEQFEIDFTFAIHFYLAKYGP